MCAAAIKTDKQGFVATLTISNPDKRNALDKEAWGRLSYALASLDMDKKLRCVVLRGDGTQAFAAGADISEFPQLRANAQQARDYVEVVAMALATLRGLRHPTVAMIHGACTGGGLEIACCCDMRIAGRSARLGVPINRIGHALAPAEMKPALDLVGPAVVLEMLLEGRLFDADEALQRGLVNRVVDDQALADTVYATAERISAGAPLAARMTKKTLQRLGNPKPLSEQEVMDSYAPCDSDDYTEGVRAFLAKETPQFEGQ
ncbi:MAG: enoyl-CoA hydratase/isomerase family protein [Rhodospirillales bacterium]|nr:enoyl-CoA hydratase/isomerase family protein [Rhodospirillales bacterium]